MFEFDDFDEPTEEPVVENKVVGIRKRTVQEMIAENVNYALSLDISKLSTGIAVMKDGKLLTGNVQSKIKDSDAPTSTGRRMLELQNAILDIVGDEKHLDLICVEEAILGKNSGTSATAYALNYVIDFMLESGLISCERFVRVNNKSWKADIRKIAGLSVARTVKNVSKLATKKEKDPEKKDIIRSFQALDFPLAFKVNEYTAWSTYLKSGYQDQLDAVGLLLSTVYRYYENGVEQILKRSVSTKIYRSLKSATKGAKFTIKEIEFHPSNYQSFIKDLKKTANESISYLWVSENLGSLGVQKGIFDEGDKFVIINVEVKKPN